MKFSAYPPLPCQRHPAEAAPVRRWWLGWLQLLGAWLICMLLCANIALALAKGLPPDEARSATRKIPGCSQVEGTSKAAAKRGESAVQEYARTPRCPGMQG
jgi:hypothetical protein